MGIGGGEIFLIMLFVLIFFGADKIPEIARGLGKGISEFKKAADDIKAEINNSTGGIRNDLEDIKSNIINGASDVKDEVQQVQTNVSDTVTTDEASFDIYKEVRDLKEPPQPSKDAPDNTVKPR
ncbi:MAG: twin-arginine translocase TatA/TatE family subunit [Bacteroidota bacterium]|nr:twin-arginine translocase TatA/TatE family subunit [Bacteroidota bacterium]